MTLDRALVEAALPGYEVQGELGRGAWGVVLAGRHRTLEREVAIKQLPRAFAADPGVRARFLIEARTLANLDHPHIVPVHDFVEHDGLCLLVMEKLEGGSAWNLVLAGASPENACAVALAACDALQYAHEHGILHRDVKPQNLMFSDAGVLKVTDFGIAKVLGGSSTMLSMTRQGEVLGTPAYMAPEQAEGKELTPATDVYAAGMVLYELLSGRLPFPEVNDPMVLLYHRVHEEPQPLRETAPQITASVAEVVMRAIARSPEDRYTTALDFARAIVKAADSAIGPDWLSRASVTVMANARFAPHLREDVKSPDPPTPEHRIPHDVEELRASLSVEPAALAPAAVPGVGAVVPSDADEAAPAELLAANQVVRRAAELLPRPPSQPDPGNPPTPGPVLRMGNQPSIPAQGTRFGSYRLGDLLGQDAIGATFRATRERSEEVVALKVVRRELSESEVYAPSFARDYSIATQIRADHLPSILEAGQLDGRCYVASTFVPGRPLKERIRSEGPLSQRELASCMAGVGAALQTLHEAGLVHAEVNPLKVILSDAGIPMLTDFGVARGVAQAILAASHRAIGALDYLAPEIILGKEATPASDVYALGCVAYESLSGSPPFATMNVLDLAFAFLSEQPPSPSLRTDVPPAAAEVVKLALAKEPGDRPQTPMAFVNLFLSSLRSSSHG